MIRRTLLQLMGFVTFILWLHYVKGFDNDKIWIVFVRKSLEVCVKFNKGQDMAQTTLSGRLEFLKLCSYQRLDEDLKCNKRRPMIDTMEQEETIPSTVKMETPCGFIGLRSEYLDAIYVWMIIVHDSLKLNMSLLHFQILWHWHKHMDYR